MIRTTIKSATSLFAIAPWVFGALLALQLSACASHRASTDATSVDSSSALINAAAAGDLAQVKSLLDAGQPVNGVSSNGTALTRAAEAGKVKVVMALLRAGADPNLGVADGQTSPLHRMVELGDQNAIRTLIAAGADLDQRDEAGLTPVAIAVRNGDLPAAKALIKAGANVNLVIQGESLLMQVVEQNSLLMTQVLIQAGADVNFETDTGNSALKIARGKHYGDIEMLLIQSGARS